MTIQYQQKKFIAHDSLRNIEKQKSFQEMSVKYQTELKASENKLLKAKNEKQKWALLSTIVGLILAFSFLIVIWGRLPLQKNKKR